MEHLEALRLEPFDLVNEQLEFAGEQLSLSEAQARRRQLVASGRRVLLAPAKYRHSTVSADEALTLAQALFEGRKSLYATTFAPPRLYSESPMFYSVIFVSSAWQAEGRVPGGVTISIDKLDGHEWDPEAFETWLDMTGVLD